MLSTSLRFFWLSCSLIACKMFLGTAFRQTDLTYVILEVFWGDHSIAEAIFKQLVRQTFWSRDYEMKASKYLIYDWLCLDYVNESCLKTWNSLLWIRIRQALLLPWPTLWLFPERSQDIVWYSHAQPKNDLKYMQKLAKTKTNQFNNFKRIVNKTENPLVACNFKCCFCKCTWSQKIRILELLMHDRTFWLTYISTTPVPSFIYSCFLKLLFLSHTLKIQNGEEEKSILYRIEIHFCPFNVN